MHIAKPSFAPHATPHLHQVADGKPEVIGKVTAAQGDAFIVRGGERIPAKAEAPVFQGDAVETQAGAQISLVFADRETFVLKDKGMVALDEFSFDPVHKTGKATFLIAQGAFTAVSGDIAKTSPDSFRIATPTMTIGVRGTTVSGQVGSDGATSVALLADPGSNFVGEMVLGKLGGGEAIVVNTAGSGVVNATSTSSWSVSATAAVAVAAFAPPAVAPPAVAPALPAAPAAAPGGTGQAPGGTGATQAAAAAAGAAAQVAAKAAVAAAPAAAAQVGEGAQAGQKAATNGPAAATGDPVAPVNVAEAAPPPPVGAPGPVPGSTTLGTLGGPTGTTGPGGSPTGTGSPGGGGAGGSSGLFNANPGGGGSGQTNPINTGSTNTAPTTTSVTLSSGTENMSMTISKAALLANAHDANGDPLKVTGLSADHGTITDNGDGTVTFVPASNYVGPVTITYTVDDGRGGTAPGTASLALAAPGNTAPTLSVANLTTTNDHTQAGAAATGADADSGDTVSYHLTGGTVSGSTESLVTAHGTVVINTTTGGYTFTPNAGAASLAQGQTASDSFDVVATDNHGANSAAGTVSVTITGSNDAPTVAVGNLTTSDDHTLVSSAATSADADSGATVSYHLTGGTVSGSTESLVTAHGTAVIDTVTGGYTFTPNAGAASLGQGQTASDSFDVVAIDDHGASSAAGTVSVTITGSNDAPTNSGAVALSAGFENVGITIAQSALLIHAVDPDSGDTLGISSISVNNGTATLSGSNVIFTPNTNFTGTETFTYTIADGHGGTVGGSATMAVNAPSALLTQSGTVLHATTTTALGDADFLGYSGASTLVFDVAAGSQSAVLGANATTTGITTVDASVTTGSVTVNAAASTQNLTFTGGSGNNVFTGGAGNDTFTGGVGADTLTGGGGGDVFVYTAPGQSLDAGASRDVITDFTTGSDHIKLSLTGTHVDVSGFVSNAGSYNGGQAAINVGGVVPGEGFYSSGDAAFYIYVTGGTTDIVADGGYVIGSASQINAADLQFVITGTAGADTLVGGVGNDTFIGGGGADTLIASGGDDVFQMGTADLGAATIDGGVGSSHIVLSDAGTVADAAFAHVTNMTGILVVHDGDVLTLGTNWQASGMGGVDASLTTGTVTVDASATTSYAGFNAGSGTDVFIGGNNAGSVNNINVSTAALTNDTFTGGAGYNSLSFTDAGTVADAAFAHVTNMPSLQLHDGDSVELGANSQAAGITFASAYRTTGTEVMDASARTDVVTLQAGSGNDTLIAGTGADVLFGDIDNIGATTFVPTAAGAAVTINSYMPTTSNIELDDSKFHLGTAGTLAASNYAEDTTVANTISGTAHDFNAGVHAAGVVAINDSGSGATLWYTADMAAATTANSHEFANVSNVNTTALDNTKFHLHV